MSSNMGFISFLNRRWAWSKNTFGTGKRTLGIIKHIKKELEEVEANPDDLTEWVDVINLAIDGYTRHGGKSNKLLTDLFAKLKICESRTYPFPASEDEPSEHVR